MRALRARKAPRRKPSPGRLIKYAISGSRVALICVLCLVSTKMSLTSTEKCDDGDTFCRAILGTWLRAFVVTFASLPLPREKPSTPFATLALHALVGELLLGSPGRVSHFQLRHGPLSDGALAPCSWTLGPRHRCRILKVQFATGATGQPHQMPHH